MWIASRPLTTASSGFCNRLTADNCVVWFLQGQTGGVEQMGKAGVNLLLFPKPIVRLIAFLPKKPVVLVFHT